MNDNISGIDKRDIKKIMFVFGTRPEAIKMAPLVNAFKKHSKDFSTIVTVTGQHRQMLDQVINLFNIKPDYDLNIMQSGQDLTDVTTRILTGMRSVFKEVLPDLVFVHGDTTTSTAAALAAFYAQIPVGHIEAGLRTGNIYSPWPEEMNRRITGRIATFHFSPTQLSKNNLLAENVKEDNITVTGNTVIDALKDVVSMIKGDKNLESELHNQIKALGYDTDRLSSEKKMVLITGHRRESFGEGFKNICHSIMDLSLKYPDVDFVYPMHMNPNVRKPISEIFGKNKPVNTFFIEPLDYLPFVYMMNLSHIILTDSGGIQEEAPSLGKPVLVMREITERPEAIEAGTIILVGTDREKIIDHASNLLDDEELYNKHALKSNPYGDGHACERVISFVKNNLK